jgi:hypothetical protein
MPSIIHDYSAIGKALRQSGADHWWQPRALAIETKSVIIVENYRRGCVVAVGLGVHQPEDIASTLTTRMPVSQQ